MSRRILPRSLQSDQAKVENQVQRDQATTQTVYTISDPSGNVRVALGLIAGRYGVRVYDNTGAVAYDFTVAP